MVDPAVALLIFGLLVLVALALFWPEKGVVPRLLQVAGMTERVRVEDCLKHLYKCEYYRRPCTVESVAGSVGVNRSQAVQILDRLEEQDLARATGEGFALTDAGREYAVHVVRAHRLLERYLADRTGVQPRDWHGRAERGEHRLSPSQAQALSSRLGHPLYDPHGDPIPTVDGEVPPFTGRPLTSLEPGRSAVIVHLEDEPGEIYETLTHAGLAPHMTVHLLTSDGGEVRFEADGREHALRPVEAANITVEPLPDEVPAEEERNTLAELQEGQDARVVEIRGGLQGPQRRRLMDLGLVPGTVVRAELKSAGGDPTAYRVRGALIALRSDQARWIRVED